jgi:hypothetical protein
MLLHCLYLFFSVSTTLEQEVKTFEHVGNRSRDLRYSRHTQSWSEVHQYVETHLKVWAAKANQMVLPTLLPWLESSMDDMTFVRSDTEEGCILWCNLPTVGVVSAMKKDYFLQLITGLLTSRPSNSICVVLQANRASETKQRK